MAQGVDQLELGFSFVNVSEPTQDFEEMPYARISGCKI